MSPSRLRSRATAPAVCSSEECSWPWPLPSLSRSSGSSSSEQTDPPSESTPRTRGSPRSCPNPKTSPQLPPRQSLHPWVQKRTPSQSLTRQAAGKAPKEPMSRRKFPRKLPPRQAGLAELRISASLPKGSYRLRIDRVGLEWDRTLVIPRENVKVNGRDWDPMIALLAQERGKDPVAPARGHPRDGDPVRSRDQAAGSIQGRVPGGSVEGSSHRKYREVEPRRDQLRFFQSVFRPRSGGKAWKGSQFPSRFAGSNRRIRRPTGHYNSTANRALLPFLTTIRVVIRSRSSCLSPRKSSVVGCSRTQGDAGLILAANSLLQPESWIFRIWTERARQGLSRDRGSHPVVIGKRIHLAAVFDLRQVAALCRRPARGGDRARSPGSSSLPTRR